MYLAHHEQESVNIYYYYHYHYKSTLQGQALQW